MKDKDEIINMSEIKESATLVDKEKFESKKSLPPEEPIESANLNENNSGNFLNNEKNILSPQIEEKINT